MKSLIKSSLLLVTCACLISGDVVSAPAAGKPAATTQAKTKKAKRTAKQKKATTKTAEAELPAEQKPAQETTTVALKSSKDEACCTLAAAGTRCGCAKKQKPNKTTPNTTNTTEKSTQVAVRQLEGGLKLETLKEADASAQTPSKGQRLTVHYTGWLAENVDTPNKFDSSVDRGRPFTFVVGQGQVIKGWDNALLNMKKGEKCRVTIPSEMGYGARGAGPKIPGNATLVFDVELLDIA